MNNLSSRPWGEVTDPTNHDPESFRYLIHLDTGKRFILDEPGPDGLNDRYEYAIDDPGLLTEYGQLSTSLIDQQHTQIYWGTTSQHGYIVEVDADAIVAASPRDMMLRARSLAEVLTVCPVLSADEILAATADYDHNEILVSPANLVIRAVFWANLQEGAETDPPLSREYIQLAASRADLPFIELDLVRPD